MTNPEGQKTEVPNQEVTDFYEVGFEWMQRARQHHQDMVGYLHQIAQQLHAHLERILEAIRSLPGKEELVAKMEEIRNLEKSRDEFQARTSWAEAECTTV